MPGNLRLKTEKEKLTSRENSITLMHKNKNVKSVHLEDANKIVDNLNEIWEEISWMPLTMFRVEELPC